MVFLFFLFFFYPHHGENGKAKSQKGTRTVITKGPRHGKDNNASIKYKDIIMYKEKMSSTAIVRLVNLVPEAVQGLTKVPGRGQQNTSTKVWCGFRTIVWVFPW